MLILLAVACNPTLSEQAYDRDGDGFRAVQVGGDDCDDSDPQVHPNAAEVCGDEIDNDCDDVVDDKGVGESEWFPDLDGDGFGAGEGQLACPNAALPGWTRQAGDCDDANNGVHPGVTDAACDGVDNDCNGIVDDSEVVPLYLDEDGDGVGAIRIKDCGEVPAGVAVVTEDGDCDDADPLVHPGVLDICDGIDNDCSGVVDDDGVATSDGTANHATVGDAIRAAEDSVLVCSGVFKVAPLGLAFSASIEVRGQGISETTLLSAGSQIFFLPSESALVLEDLALVGAGLAPAVEALDGASVRLERVRVANNSTGVFVEGKGEHALIDVEFVDNLEEGLQVGSGAHALMEGGWVEGNREQSVLVLPGASFEGVDVDWGFESSVDIEIRNLLPLNLLLPDLVLVTRPYRFKGVVPNVSCSTLGADLECL